MTTQEKFLVYLKEHKKRINLEEILKLKQKIDMNTMTDSKLDITLKKLCRDFANGVKVEKEDLKKISYLKEIIDEHDLIRDFLKQLEIIFKPKEEKEDDLLYNCFEPLSILIINSKFSAQERVEILFHAIKVNAYNPNVEKMINNKNVDGFGVPNLLDEENLNLFDEFRTVIENLVNIKEKYFEKLDSYTENDVESIMNSLNQLCVKEELCRTVRKSLLKEIERRNKKEISLNKNITTEIKKDLLTDKEYKAIKKELRTYFDFYNVEKIRELKEEEIIYCIELLIKINTPLTEIQRFVKQFEKSENDDLLDTKNPISLYVELYNKLKFYESKLDIKDSLDYIEKCLEEMFICETEYYELYKNEIEAELRKIMLKLPQTFEYEINEIQKRISLKKS